MLGKKQLQFPCIVNSNQLIAIYIHAHYGFHLTIITSLYNKNEFRVCDLQLRIIRISMYFYAMLTSLYFAALKVKLMVIVRYLYILTCTSSRIMGVYTNGYSTVFVYTYVYKL